jgi:hypothetical protein
MMAVIEVSGEFIDPAFWDTLFISAVVLSLGVVVGIVGPGLLWRLLRPTVKVLQRTPGAETNPRATAEVCRIAQSLAETDPRAPRGEPAGAEGKARGPVARGRAGRPVVSACRRKNLRRGGRPRRITLSDGLAAPALGWVVNRSRGGLGIALDRMVIEGTVIEVRPTDAPEDVPWVQLIVRSCRRKGKRWYIGCQFKAELSWSLILMFG